MLAAGCLWVEHSLSVRCWVLGDQCFVLAGWLVWGVGFFTPVADSGRWFGVGGWIVVVR